MRPLMALALIAWLLLALPGRAVAPLEAAAPAKPIRLQAGVAAPDFRLKTPQGKSLSLKGLRGRPVLINFWATWCNPCVEEMHLLQQLHPEWSPKGLTILGVNEGDPSAKVTGFVQRYGITFPVLLDEDQDVARLYSVRYMPTSVLVDREGVIRAVAFGGFATKEEFVDKLLSKLEKGP